MFSEGRTPFAGMSNSETKKAVCKEGYRMKPPPRCPPEISSLLTECWRYEDKERPSMEDIVEYLDEVRDLYPEIGGGARK
jgi:hypothetical protein